MSPQIPIWLRRILRWIPAQHYGLEGKLSSLLREVRYTALALAIMLLALSVVLFAWNVS